MTTATKIFLATSVTGFTVGGIVDFGGFPVNPMWTVALPIGAIFLGVWLISLVMEKEVARYDEEQAQKIALARCQVVTKEQRTPGRANPSPYEDQTFQAIR